MPYYLIFCITFGSTPVSSFIIARCNSKIVVFTAQFCKNAIQSTYRYVNI